MFPAPQPSWIYAISQTQAVLSASVSLLMFIQPAEILRGSMIAISDLRSGHSKLPVTIFLF